MSQHAGQMQIMDIVDTGTDIMPLSGCFDRATVVSVAAVHRVMFED